MDLQYDGASSAHFTATDSYLSDWLGVSSTHSLVPLWQALEADTVGCLHCRSANGRLGQLTITPLQGRFLVEFIEEALSPEGIAHCQLGTTPGKGQKADRADIVAAFPFHKSIQTVPANQGYNSWLSAIVEHTPVGLSLLAPIRQAGRITDFSFLYTNPAHSAMTGFSINYLEGQTFKSTFPGAAEAGLFDRLAEVCETGLPQKYQKQVEHDGIFLWGEFALTRAGANVLFSVMDISPLKQAKTQLREKNQELEKQVAERTMQMQELFRLQNTILNHAGQAILATNQHGVIHTTNPACETLLGYTSQDLNGMAVHFRNNPEEDSCPVISFKDYDPTEPPNPFFESLLAQQEYTQQECLVQLQQNRQLPVLLTVSRLANQMGTTVGYVGIATDISALKTAEARLQQKNRMLKTFFDEALDMHSISDGQGQFSEVNFAFHQGLGYSAEELIAIPFLCLIHPDEQKDVYLNLLKGILQQPVRHQVNRFRKKDGTYRIFEWNAIGIENLVYGSARDITEREQAEGQLRALHERLQLATQSVGQGIWEVDLRTGQIIWDECLWTLNGLPKPIRELTYDDYLNTIHPEDRSTFERHSRTQLANSVEHISHVYRILRPDGVVRYMETNGRIIRNDSGQPIRLIGVARDATQRQLVEHSLRASEQRYRSLVNHLEIVVFQTDSQGLWTYLNPAWEAITGFGVEESLGRLFMDSILPEDRQGIQTNLRQLGAEGQTIVRYVIRYIHKVDGYRWMDVYAQLQWDEQQNLMGVTGTLTDITKRKEAEEALLESEQRFREIAENVDEVFWVRAVHEPRFLYINRAFETFTGMSAQELYKSSLKFLDFVLDEDRADLQTAFMSNDPGYSFQFRARHQDGSLRWLSARVFGIYDDKGELIRRLGVATDITTAIEKEQILEESLARERRVNILKSQFVTTASHEFRTPLSGISSSVELVQFYLNRQDLTKNLPLINKHLDNVLAKVYSLTELISDTLTVSKIEEGRIAVHLAPTDLVALSQALITTTFNDRSDKRQVELTIVGDTRGVMADKKLLTHILTNLLGNAFKFSTKNPRLTIQYEKGRVMLAVTDEGIGIPTNELPYLFDKFYRASNAVNFPGTGLGLAICQEYMALQQGILTVNSTQGLGTTFTIMFQ
jgi:PAS domain S-box-containing protein